MDVINKLTLKHLKQNKKRTLVTILGIIISVAMFTAVTTFATSFMHMMQNEAVKYSGNWHVSYQNVDSSKVATIKEQKNTKNIVSLYQYDTTLLNNTPLTFEQRPFIDIQTLDSNGFKEALPLLEGTYPKNEQEIVISNNLLKQGKIEYKIGDTIRLYGGYQEMATDAWSNGTAITCNPNATARQYTITGISDDCYLDPTFGNSFGVYTLTTPQSIQKATTNTQYVTLQSVTNKLYDESEKLAKDLQLSLNNVDYNRPLLIYYGVTTNDGFIEAMTTIVFIIMTIIMIGSIALIYNAFAISLSERSKYLGMIASVGATKTQKRKSVFFEGFLLGMFSIPLGVMSGIGGLAITFKAINPIIRNISNSDGFPLTISIPGIILAIFFAIITILLATYIPARRASKITPIEALRASKDIKISNKNVKTGKLTKLLFGFEGELAMKNLKRNKKRYRITVLSLIVSVVLFLSVSGFTYYLKNSYTMANASINYDISISTTNENTALLKEIQSLKNIEQIATTRSLSLSATIPQKDMNQDVLQFLQEQGKNISIEEDIYLSIEAYSYDDAYFKEYTKENNIALDKDSVLIMKNNVIGENRKFKEAPLLDYQNDLSKITITAGEGADDFTLPYKNIVLEQHPPLGISQARNYYTITMIVSHDTLAQLEKLCGYPSNTHVYMKTNDAIALDKVITPILENYDDCYYTNIAKEANVMEQMIFIINVFTYGFIILISLISIANIFNTITSSVALRTKEFSMLKSVGMTPKAFNKMIYFESLFYGMQALIIGIPIGMGIMYWMHNSMNSVFNNSFSMPTSSFIIVIIAVFVIVGSTLLFSTSKVKKQNIIDGLKEENV